MKNEKRYSFGSSASHACEARTRPEPENAVKAEFPDQLIHRRLSVLLYHFGQDLAELLL